MTTIIDANETEAIIDADYIKYNAASTGQKNSIIVDHPVLGQNIFKTRTEFYGRDKAKSGGWLGELNKGRDSPYLPSEFEIATKVIPEPLPFVLHTAKLQIEKALGAADTRKFKAFLGKGDSFRVERSTLWKYKGNRENLEKPYHLDAVTEYIKDRLDAEYITGIESDDRCVIECYKKPHRILVGCDKDFYGSPVNFRNINKLNEPVINCNCFGRLWLEENGKTKKVRGYGRMFLYFQTCSEDDVDEYKANCYSDTKWSAMSAYKMLVDCKTDKEAWERIVETFKILYPEAKTITGWRGTEFEIDWHYVCQEVFTMARMLKVENEPEILVKDILDRMKIEY